VVRVGADDVSSGGTQLLDVQAAAWALTQYVQSQLYGVTRSDPMTIVMATAGLTAVACLAGYMPAVRASRADPMLALRYE